MGKINISYSFLSGMSLILSPSLLLLLLFLISFIFIIYSYHYQHQQNSQNSGTFYLRIFITFFLFSIAFSFSKFISVIISSLNNPMDDYTVNIQKIASGSVLIIFGIGSMVKISKVLLKQFEILKNIIFVLFVIFSSLAFCLSFEIENETLSNIKSLISIQKSRLFGINNLAFYCLGITFYFLTTGFISVFLISKYFIKTLNILSFISSAFVSVLGFLIIFYNISFVDSVLNTFTDELYKLDSVNLNMIKGISLLALAFITLLLVFMFFMKKTALFLLLSVLLSIPVYYIYIGKLDLVVVLIKYIEYRGF